MKPKICHECLKPSDRLWDHKGTPVCPNCYHKKNNAKKFINHNNEPFRDRKPTMADVKKKFEESKW